MEETLEILRYPVGKFDWSKDVSKAERDQAIQKVAAFPGRIREVVEKLNEDQLDTPYRTDGWTIRQVVHHCADSHMNAYIRFKLALTEDKPVIKPYLEAEWAKMPDYRLDPAVSLNLLEGIHMRWVTLMENMSEKEWSLGFTHPEHNRWMVLDKTVAMYAWHCEHHLGHITGLVERMGW
ncbi:MAG TPA: putative metal-dependent hydrolase [Saprospiraceae bacterium]|nr:putative metal-dependent hydrolase [Saprospiraceae bacterium]